MDKPPTELFPGAFQGDSLSCCPGASGVNDTESVETPSSADGKVDPDWLVVPDGSQPRAWRLLHTVSKGGRTRFSVGSTIRYPPGQAEDVANKAKEYQFEAAQDLLL